MGNLQQVELYGSGGFTEVGNALFNLGADAAEDGDPIGMEQIPRAAEILREEPLSPQADNITNTPGQ